MEKEFVPYELALRMKTLGFNENCYRVGNPNGAICWRFMDVAGVEGVGIDDILLEKFDKLWWVEIPTFSQAFRWLLKEHNLYAIIIPTITMHWTFKTMTVIEGMVEAPPYKHVDAHDYVTQEEAELACLEKLIEIVESKKE